MRLQAILLTTLVVMAQAPTVLGETDQELEARLDRELRSRSPAAADTFALANRARESGKHEEAATLYGRVTHLVPDFSHSRRREGYELLALERRGDAIRRMQSAMYLDASAWNMLGLATALSAQMGSVGPSESELQEAVGLIRAAEKMDPEDADIVSTACLLAMQTQDIAWLGREATRLGELAPQSPLSPYAFAVHLAWTGDRTGAKRHIDKARALGLPDAAYQSFVQQLERRPPVTRWGTIGSFVAAGWLAGFLVLLAVGSFLSRITLEASRRTPQESSGSALGLDATLRRAYRWVLWISCAYYYVSIPLVVATVLAIGGGLTYLMLETGHVPVKLLLIVVVLTAVTVWAVVKSIFVRGRDVDPGLKMEPGENPRLRKAIDAVADRVGTATATNVYLTPGADIAVMERGGVLGQLRGHSERCLILGIGALEGMRLRPFRAILAHEFGHFSNRDTAGGGFALAVRRSLDSTALHLARGGAAAWYNPAWLFVNGFYRLFLRVSQGASRLQEVLADRWAAFTYGAAAFKEGLRHVIDRSIRFDAHANAVLAEVIHGEKSLSNLYTYQPSSTSMVEESKLSEALERAIDREPSAYDSHPRPADRFAWVDALGTDGGPKEPDDGEQAWLLFDDRVRLERRLTDEVRKNLREGQGIEIPDDDAAARREI